MTAAVAYIEPDVEPEPGLDEGNVGRIEFLQRTGITYRQLDYWTRCELLRATDCTPGSGYRRGWPASEIPVAALMSRFEKAGLNVRVAEPAARELLTTGHTTIAGIRIDLPQEQP